TNCFQTAENYIFHFFGIAKDIVSNRDVPSVEHWMRRSEEVWEETHQLIETTPQCNKSQADNHRQHAPSYVPVKTFAP
ncbi:hypothetical protein NFI96_018168, partial [Prochilodus magdalenae]